MSQHLLVSQLAVILLVAATATPVQAASHARLDTFVDAAGETYFALSLQPDTPETSPSGRDVVILLDTSASQTGDFRRDALSTLDGILARLSADDRVDLTAVDVHAVSMTRGFVAPDGPEMAEARKKLDRRVPLGSTDLAGALQAVAERFQAKPGGRARVAIYIGDGISAGNLTDTATYQKRIRRLLAQRIPLSSCPVGPRVDRRLLGSLAARTGGVVVEMGPKAAAQLAAAAGASVYWPTEKTTWPAAVEVYPKQIPPLRSDRDTVLVGSYTGDAPANVRVTATGPAGQHEFAWTVRPSGTGEERSYLKELVAWARVDGGASLPLVDSASLEQARHAVNLGAYRMARLARQAMAAQNYEAAKRLADDALRRDPNNPQALAIRRVIAARQPAVATVVPPTEASPAELILEGNIPAPGDLIATYAGHRRVVELALRSKVQTAVNLARRKMASDPDVVIGNLKVTLQMVRQSRDVTADVRNQLIGVLQAALNAAGRQRTELDHHRQHRAERAAAAKERVLLHDGLLRKQQKVDQLMARFDSLLDEGRHRLAEEVVAAAAAEELPDHPVPVAATLLARTAGYQREAMQQRIARQKGVVGTLGMVEKALLPMPDDPSIVYPPAAEWQELSARRTEKYRSMDVARRRPAERKILEALDSPTQIEFIETPLRDLFDYLEDFHDIEIEIDERALNAVGLNAGIPITRHLKGISLRSALRLILRELDLTYTVRDEVLLITTPEEIEHLMTTKVYPVVELVVPIAAPQMSGFGRLGGLGNQGGNQGGNDNIFGNNMFPQQNGQGRDQGLFNQPW
ncbi:MAG: VWA domain-containing protein [Candidatus Nealsonbacteria bacterium]|nr:VWA domain-containing protein [Candidatus Nealsonbacteria bacterium]